MKTKTQKQEELKKAEAMLEGSKALVFAEFTGVPADGVRKLRQEAKTKGGKIMMLKKRLLNLLLKQKGIDYDVRQFDSSVATLFAEDIEKGSSSLYGFFSNLGETKDEKESSIKKILGGFDLQNKTPFDAAKVVAIGKLPSREVILSQFMGMLVAPLRTFMYILQEKAKMSGAPKKEVKAEVPIEAPKEVVVSESQPETLTEAIPDAEPASPEEKVAE